MTSAAQYNGGLSQINLNFLVASGDFPFLNLFKTGAGWLRADGAGPPNPDTLDTDGYPTTVAASAIRQRVLLPTQANRPGNYVIKWDGNGTVSFLFNNTLVSGSLTSAGGTGRYVFSTTDSVHIIGISSVGSPRITNIRLCHVNDETAMDAGDVFGVKFKAKLAEANFGVVRFLNWMNTNTSNIVNWADRRPASYYTYGGVHFRSDLYCASTATLSGSTFSTAAPSAWSTLIDKRQAIVKFNTATSGSSYTLNIGGTGAKTLLDPNSSPLGTSYPAIKINTFATCTYDATLDAWIRHGADTSDFDVPGITDGVPPELLLQLCAELGAHPWFTCPAYSLDPVPTDSFTLGLLTYVAANQPSWMVPRYEPVNEIWNSGFHFFFTTFATNKANAYWGGTFSYQDWYGKVSSVLGQMANNAYSADRTRYQMIFGVQTATGQSSGATSANNDRIASTQYVLQAAAAQSPYTKTAASGWVTHLCAACYWTPNLQGSAWETVAATEYSTADAAKKKLLIDTFAQSSLDPGSPSVYTLPFVLFCFSNLKTWLQGGGYGVTKMTMYEGSYDTFFSYGNGSGTATEQFRNASVQSEYVYGLTLAMYNGIIGLSDSTFTAEFPSMFTLSQGNEPGDVLQEWALLTDIYQANTPQYNAVKAFNSPARATPLRMRLHT